MKQPELGKKLNEIRNQKGITQKELSDLCSVDIRTIQRIESGEVEPRMSTLKILAAVLENDDLLIREENNFINDGQIRIALLVSLIAGIIYFFNFILYSIVGPNFTSISGGPLLFVLSMIHIITGVLLFLGFVIIGKQQNNLILSITSILIMILIPVFVIVDSVARVTGISIFIYLIRGIVVLIGVTGIFFGAGLIKSGISGKILFTIAGVIQIIENLMFLIPFYPVQNIGLWIAIPANFTLLLILFFEMKPADNSLTQNQ